MQQHKSGTLWKRGQLNRASWLQRFFVLASDSLKYHAAQGGPELGSLDLRNARLEMVRKSWVPQIHATRWRFSVTTSKGRTLVMAAQSEAEMEAWLTALSQTMGLANPMLRAGAHLMQHPSERRMNRPSPPRVLANEAGPAAAGASSADAFRIIREECLRPGVEAKGVYAFRGVETAAAGRLGRPLGKLETDLISDVLKSRSRPGYAAAAAAASVRATGAYPAPSAGGAAGSESTTEWERALAVAERGRALFRARTGVDGVETARAHDRAVLMQLYGATGGPAWRCSDGWGQAGPLKDWFGVTAFRGRVTGLSLSGNGLCGELPEALGELTGLKEVDLSSNALTGSIPSSIGHLHSMSSLWLNGNQLSGPITPALRECMQLISLDLSGNRLQWGGLPDAFFSLVLLRELYLFSNPLADDSEQGLPAQLCHCRMLEELSVAACGLSGALPADFGARVPEISYLDVSENDLSGSALPALCPLRRVRTLRLQGNDWEDVSAGQALALASNAELLKKSSFLDQK
jgi:hypothetical protein